MSVTPTTLSQIEKVIAHTIELSDVLMQDMGKREDYLRNWPAAKFNVFAAISQLLRTPPVEQLSMLTGALKDTGETFVHQGHKTARYGAGRRCATMDDATLLEMAQSTLEVAQKELSESNLMPRRDELQNKLLYKSLFEFCVIAKLIAPVDLVLMMNRVNASVAGVIQSGWLDRNVVRIK